LDDEPPEPLPIKEFSNVTMYTDTVPGPEETILILDSGADISCIGKGFQILFNTGEVISMGVAMADVEEHRFEIVSAATVLSDPRLNRDLIIILNQAAYMPGDHLYESLLHTDQARNHHLIINDIAKCYFDRYGNAGQQSLEVDGITIPLRHDGINIREPTPHYWEICQVIEFTSPISWSKHNRIRRTKNIIEYKDDVIKEWSKRLGILIMKPPSTHYKLPLNSFRLLRQKPA
jgi:hypothetical protein